MEGQLTCFMGGEILHRPRFDLVNYTALDKILFHAVPYSRWGNATRMVQHVIESQHPSMVVLDGTSAEQLVQIPY